MLIGTACALIFGSTPTAVICILFGSLYPDIDHHKSTLGKFNPFARLMHHRGKTHTILGSALISAPLLFFSVENFYYVFLGCIGHIIGDRLQAAFTKSKFKIKIW